MAGRDAAGVTVLAARPFICTAGAACSTGPAGFALFAARFVGVRIAAAVPAAIRAAIWWIAAAAGLAAVRWIAGSAACWRGLAAAVVRVWRAGSCFSIRTSAAAGRAVLTGGTLLARSTVLARSTARRFVAGAGVSARGNLDGQRERTSAPAAQCP